jgi:lysine-specific demethylase 8
VEIGSSYVDVNLAKVHVEMGDLLTFVAKFEKCKPPQDLPLVYLAQHNIFEEIPEMQRDIRVPEIVQQGKGHLYTTNAWLGPCGTKSDCHYDPFHNVLAQIVGRKYVRLYCPSQSSLLYPWPEATLRNTSRVDVMCPDLAQYPLFAEAQGAEAVLQEVRKTVISLLYRRALLYAIMCRETLYSFLSSGGTTVRRFQAAFL